MVHTGGEMVIWVDPTFPGELRPATVTGTQSHPHKYIAIRPHKYDVILTHKYQLNKFS